MRPVHALLLAVLTLPLFQAATAPASAQTPRERMRHRLEQRSAQDDGEHRMAKVPDGARVERNIAYGTDPKQRYDVYLPTHVRAGAPILFMVHGGGWRRGDKAMANVVDNKAAHWLGKGLVFVSVNNRLVPDADPLNQARDVAAALASVQQRAKGWGADPARVMLMGHSAGAHLVVLVGSNVTLLQKAGAHRPAGVVALDSGALDVPALMAQPRLPQLYRNAFGTDPAYWASASPQQKLRADAVPMLLVCSSTRHVPTAPCAEARKLEQRGHALGVAMRVLPEAMSHGAINAELGLPSAYTRAVSDWIDQRLMQVRR